MKPALLAVGSATLLSTAFAAAQAVAFAALLVVPVATVSASDNAGSGTLYRWKEADGSLTFSPTAPTDGRPYDTVKPMTLKSADETASVQGSPSSTPAVTASSQAAAPVAMTRPPAVPVSSAALPTPAGNGKRPQLAGASASVERSSTNGAVTAPNDSAASRPRLAAATEKEKRCEELEKRVVSLERRLYTALTPEAMDNTVIQMARYQHSVDRHCR